MPDKADLAALPPAIDDESSPPAAKTPVLKRFVLWALIGAALGIVVTLVVLRLAKRDPTPALTQALFDAAHQQWKTAGPADYDIEVEVSGPQAAVYRAQVRGGVAQAAWRNGQPLVTRRTFGTWSVPGMFSTISRDLEANERLAAGRAAPGAPELLLRAAFDPRYGYPQRYRRTEWGSRRGSTAIEVSWVVTEFRVESVSK